MLIAGKLSNMQFIMVVKLPQKRLVLDGLK